MIDRKESMAWKCYSAFDNKIQGLFQLMENGLSVPEFIIIDQSEQYFYINNGDLSNVLKLKISQFINETIQKRKLPLFSIRCGSKYMNKRVKLPQSLLNIGLHAFQENRFAQYDYHYDNLSQFINQQKFTMQSVLTYCIVREVISNLLRRNKFLDYTNI